MYPERVQDHSPVVLTKEQREFYFENGYVLLESVVPMETIEPGWSCSITISSSIR